MIDVITLIVCFVVGWVIGYKAATKWGFAQIFNSAQIFFILHKN